MLTSILLKMTLLGAEWILWLLFLLSLISIALIVERSLYFFRRRYDADQLVQRLDELLRVGDVRTALETVKDIDHVACQVVAAGITAIRRGGAACSEAMLAAKNRLRPELEKRLAILATIGSNAPFIGLLGTVLGIIKAAHDLTGNAGGDPSAVMAGVFEALVATAVGLFVAIPAVVAFNLFSRQVRISLTQADTLAHLLLSRVAAETRKSAAVIPTIVPKGAPVVGQVISS